MRNSIFQVQGHSFLRRNVRYKTPGGPLMRALSRDYKELSSFVTHKLRAPNASCLAAFRVPGTSIGSAGRLMASISTDPSAYQFPGLRVMANRRPYIATVSRGEELWTTDDLTS